MTSSTKSKSIQHTTIVRLSSDLVQQARVHTAQMGGHGSRPTIEQALREFFARREKKTGKAA